MNLKRRTYTNIFKYRDIFLVCGRNKMIAGCITIYHQDSKQLGRYEMSVNINEFLRPDQTSGAIEETLLKSSIGKSSGTP